MDIDDDTRRHARMETRTSGADAGPDTHMQRWVRLRAQLSSLIGDNGFNALLGRAARLAAPQHDCLALDPTPKNGDELFAVLAQRLAATDAATQCAANEALMDAFTRQLTGLIGAALTARLLASAFEGSAGSDKDRSTSK
jgi:hypothetical protein